MSLLKFLTDEFAGVLQKKNDQKELKKLVLNGPETLVGYFLDKDNKSTLKKATGNSLKGKKQFSLNYIEGELDIILSDIKITTGYDEETKNNYQTIKSLGFFRQKIGSCISAQNEEDMKSKKKNSFLYNSRPYNYASLSMIASENRFNTFINTGGDELVIILHLNHNYFRSILENFYKNIYCEVSLDCDYYIDQKRNRYYINNLSQRNSGVVRFSFDPSKSSLTYNKIQIENLLADTFV